jgi:hypothetical protein
MHGGINICRISGGTLKDIKLVCCVALHEKFWRHRRIVVLKPSPRPEFKLDVAPN